MNLGYKRWLAILAIGLGFGAQVINWSMVTIALATIQRDFSASISDLQWMVNMFGIFIAVFLVTMGRLADTYGRRRLYACGFAGAGIASLMAGLGSHPGWIIAAQGLWGVSGAILMPVSQVLILQVFPEKQSGKAIGVWAVILGVAMSIGPLLGGLIIHALGWRWIFLVNIPVVITGLFLLFSFVQESKSKAHRNEFDVLGVALLGFAVGSLVLAVIQGPNWGWGSPLSLFLFSLSALSCFLLVYVEKRARFPILHTEFFLNRAFLLSSIGIFCMNFFFWAFFFLLPLYFQNALGISSLETGMVMLLATVPMALLGAVVGKFCDRKGCKLLMSIGFVILLLSVLLQLFLESTEGLLLASAAAFCFGIGSTFIVGPSTTVALTSLPKDLAGVASGGFNTVQEIGGTLGLTLTGTVFRVGQPLFMTGYRNGLYLISLVLLIGLIASLLLGRRRNFKNS